MRNTLIWLFVWLALATVLALGAIAFAVALVAAPVLFFVLRLLGGRLPKAPPRRPGGDVYEGEFHVLEERGERRS